MPAVNMSTIQKHKFNYQPGNGSPGAVAAIMQENQGIPALCLLSIIQFSLK